MSATTRSRSRSPKSSSSESSISLSSLFESKSRSRSRDDAKTKTMTRTTTQTDRHLVQLAPVLIIPGIMSSGLEVRKSAVNDKRVGERVWFNPISLGFGKLHFGGSFSKLAVAKPNGERKHHQQHHQRHQQQLEQEQQNGDSLGPILEESGEDGIEVLEDDTERCQDEQKDLDFKSSWLQHMTLTSDMCTEREGNEIRPIPGLDGVDFLTDVANINIGASYVFGPVIKLLKGIGYTKGKNLDACPYDWRIPPSVLEQRDAYFTNTMKRIEQMVLENEHRPVVLLCHSMGAKTGHYLLNFVLETKGPRDGRDWIDKHVHTYMTLGGVHLGVPSVLASAFSAEINPVLDPLLSLEERLVFSRSMGSGVWLMPTTLPSIERNAPPAILCKREGKLTIEILTTEEHPLGDLRVLVTNKHGSRKVGTFKVQCSYGDKTNDEDSRTKVLSGKAIPVAPPEGSEGGPDAQYFDLPCPKFVFPTPASLLPATDEETKTNHHHHHHNHPLKPIRFTLYERGDVRARYLEPTNKVIETYKIINGHVQMSLLKHAAAKKAGIYKTKLGMASIDPFESIDVFELVEAGARGLTLTVPIVARTDMTLRGYIPKNDHRSINMKVNIRWDPPPSSETDDRTNPIAAIPRVVDESEATLFRPIPVIRSTRASDEASDYVPLSGQAILREEGLEDTFVALAREQYGRDPIGPRDRSSLARPPVQRIFAIYGTNVDTAVSTVCRRVLCYHEDETPEELLSRPRFAIDTETRLEIEPIAGVSTSSGHKLEGGTLYEHAGTPQIDLLTGATIRGSGDGSVPYYCLQQAQIWAKELGDDREAGFLGETVRIEELEGAQHRCMLSDKRFHALLVEYLLEIASP